MARVLVVDDNGPNLQLMQYLLKAFGHEVVGFNDAGTALESALNDRFDLILADIRMPGMDGFEFLRRYKERRHGEAPVVAVTALAMVGDKERMLEAGFDGYMAKPIDPESFKAHIDEVLARSRASRPVILAVDDVEVNLDVLEHTLTPFGFRVVRANSVSEAIAALESLRPALIICDLHMPPVDAFSLIEHVKRDDNLAAIPLLVISSTSWQTSDKQRALALGAKQFILRPIEPQKLVDTVRAALAG